MTTTPIPQAAGIVKQYGKSIVLGDVDLHVMPGTVHSVVEPSNAGKTMLFHMLTSTHMITGGAIVFDGRDVTREADYQRVQHGIARSFQVASLFPSLSVRGNLRLTALGTMPRHAPHGWRLPQGELACANTIDRMLNRLELPRLADTSAAIPSHGQQRRLEADMALAVSPRAIFLDEPTSGVGVDGLPAMKVPIHGLAQDHTVVPIKHNVDIMMDVSDIITVIQQGRMPMEGVPNTARADPRVRAAYLGNMITEGKAWRRRRFSTLQISTAITARAMCCRAWHSRWTRANW